MPDEERTEPLVEPGAPEPAPAPVTDIAAAEVERLKAELAAAETRAAETLDRLLRLQADFENHRKRVRREQEETRKFATERLVKELLEVLGNFERALTAGGSPEALREGVALVARQFRGILEKEGLQPIAAEGAAFDPSLHEAVSREVAEGVPEGTVVREYERGYTLHGKVVRPARVGVAVAPGPASG